MGRELTKKQAAFLESIAEKYNAMLFRYCAKCISYNPKIMPFVPDLIQEVYLKASLNVDILMHHNNVPGWLKKSCHFSLLNMLRNHRNGREVLYPTAEKLHLLIREDYMTISNDEDSITLDEVITAAEMILSDEEQAIFNDYFLDDLSTSETAQLNHMTYDTVRGKISRIRKKLKAHFDITSK